MSSISTSSPVNSRRLAGKVALVTGGAQGIGLGIAQRFAAEGAEVIIGDINAQNAQASASAIAALGDAVTAIGMDISQADSVAAAAKLIETQFGGIDILVNNASVVDLVGFNELTFDHYSRILRINLDGALIVSMAMVPMMRSRSHSGRILNIASIMGVRSAPGAVAYSVAKGGIVNLTRSLACELAGDGIVVNALAPGYINTPMCIMPDGSHEHDQAWFKDIYIKYKRIPLGRAGLPEDIAGPALFFCSDDARYVTGQILLVDGGVSATF